MRLETLKRHLLLSTVSVSQDHNSEEDCNTHNGDLGEIRIEHESGDGISQPLVTRDEPQDYE